MGGDFAPSALVSGAFEAARGGTAVTLVGPTATLEQELAKLGGVGALPITLTDSDDAVAMDDAPLAALRRKPRASIRVAAELVARDEAQALFTAGHTGAALIAAHGAFGMIEGVLRPALAVTVPTRTGPALLLDVGANPECRPEHLHQFGVMGAAYARVALDLPSPRVAVLSIGEEPGKGTDLTREAHARLSTSGLNFVGNLEARDLFRGLADVVVCDGFTGNVALKVGEGLAELVDQLLREELASAIAAHSAVRDALQRFSRRVDAAEHGAAPLLGVGKLALVGHGRSTPRAVASGITLAARLARDGIVRRLADALRPRS